MSVADKKKTLLKLLYERTMSNKLDWNVPSPSSNSPYVWIGERQVSLQTGENINGEPTEVIVILNSSGDFVESIDDEMFSGSPSFGDEDNYWRLMNKLREAARRQAIGADSALDDLISLLDDPDDDIPF